MDNLRERIEEVLDGDYARRALNAVGRVEE